MALLGVVGATGYTGRLIVRELLARGLPFVAVGRNPAKLDALPDGDYERRLADAGDVDSLRKTIGGCAAVCATVGPFVDLGEPVLRAAVDAGAHYIDTTGEQAFMRLVFDVYGPRAAAAGKALVSGVGFDYVPGDMAAALAARALGRTPDAVEVAYLVTKAKSSDGTKRTGLRMAGMPCWVWEDGQLVARKMGDDQRRFGFPEPYGEANVALWPGGEPLTVPRHTGARNVSVYMRMPKVAVAAVRTAGLASPVLRAGKAIVGQSTDGPSDDDRARARFVVVAVARAGDERVRCVLTGRDMYGMTAAACAEAMTRMTAAGFDRSGALAPSEAFDPEGFLRALGDWIGWEIQRPN